MTVARRRRHSPRPTRNAPSASASARPPPETSWIDGEQTAVGDEARHQREQAARGRRGRGRGASPPRRPWHSTAQREPASDGIGLAQQHERRPGARSAIPGGRRSSRSMTPSTATTGRGVDVGPAARVVEADVAADDGDVERPAGLGHAVDGLRQLPHDLGVLGVAEVEAVDQGHGPGPGAGHVEGRLGHGHGRARAGGRARTSGVGVGGEGQAPAARRAGPARPGAARRRPRPGPPRCSGRAGGRTGGRPTTVSASMASTSVGDAVRRRAGRRRAGRGRRRRRALEVGRGRDRGRS